MTEMTTAHDMPAVTPEVTVLTDEVMARYAVPIDFIVQTALDVGPSSVIVMNRRRMYELETAKVVPDEDTIKTMREAVSIIVAAAVRRGYEAGASSQRAPKEQGEIDG